MKLSLTILALCISTSLFADGGDMGGGRARFSKAIMLEASSIEAVVSKDGVYSRLDDLREGYEKMNGLEVFSDKALFRTSNPATSDVDRIIFINDIKKLEDLIKAARSGGDMGGG